MTNLVVIKSVKLNNILSHAQTEIVFPLGLIALVGPNGAGKSSIIDSIIYTLFINPQNVRGFRGSSKKSFLRSGALNGFIEIELSVGGKRYIVYRSISISRGDEAILYEVLDNDKKRVIASGVQTVLDYIKQLLSIPSAESIRYTIISRQNEITRLIEEAPSVRKEVILRLLGLDELEKSKELLKMYLDQINSDRILFEKLKLDLAEVRRKIQELQQAIDHSKAELRKFEEEADILSKKVSQYEKLLDLLRRYEAISKAMDIVTELKQLEQIIPICRDIANIDLNEYISLFNILKEQRRELDEALQRLHDIDNKFKMLVENISNELGINITVDNNHMIIEYLEEISRGIEIDKSFKQAELSIAKNSIGLIEKSNKCPLCGRELDDNVKNRILYDIEHRMRNIIEELNNLSIKYNIVRKYIDEAKKLDRSRIELQSKINSFKKYLEEEIKRFKEIKNIVENIIDLARNTPMLSNCVSRSNTTIEALKCLNKLVIEIMKSYEEKKTLVNRLINIHDSNYSMDNIISLYNDIKKQIASLGFNIDKLDIRNIEIEYKEIISKFNNVKEVIGKIKGRLESYTKLLNELSIKEKELDEKLLNLKKNIDLYPVLDIIVNKLLGKDGLLAKVLTSKTRRLVEKYSNVILRELGMDFRIEIGEDFSIEVYTNYGELDIRSLSGGEMVALAIALRIALAYTIFGKLPGFFVLDEPTQFLDVERRRAIFEIIKRLSERVPQVIVVTHDSEVIELADRVFYISKEGGRSVVREKGSIVETIVRG